MTTTECPNDLLRIVQWMSPAFPLGSFAFSHGLETAISQGTLNTATQVEAWVRGVVLHGSGRCDGAVLAMVLDGMEAGQADALARSLAAGPERLLESEAQGRAFLDTTNALLGTDLRDLLFPVALGVQAGRLQLATTTVISLYLQSFASNLVLGAVRFVPLGQTEGQRILQALGPDIAHLAQGLSAAPETGLWSAGVAADIASMAHEHQEVRVFRT